MWIVEEALAFPHYCAVTGTSEGPFVDTGATVRTPNTRVYLKTSVVKDLGRLVGMADEDTHAELVAENFCLRERVEQLEREMVEDREALDAIALIQGRGFKPQKKRGPKPKAVEA